MTVYLNLCLYFFFFKQKTAYEMLRSLVGSEMCIRDRRYSEDLPPAPHERTELQTHTLMITLEVITVEKMSLHSHHCRA